VVGENTHLTRLGGDVDLDDLLGLVDGLDGCGNIWSARPQFHHQNNPGNPSITPIAVLKTNSSGGMMRSRYFGVFSKSYLVRKGKAELDLFAMVAMVS